MLENSRLIPLKASLKAAEDLSTLSSINISNSYTLGYKALVGRFIPNCHTRCFDEVLLNPTGSPLQLNVTESDKPGRKIKINGQEFESSNVNPSQEIKSLVDSANLTRSALAALQIEVRMQQEILRLAQ